MGHIQRNPLRNMQHSEIQKSAEEELNKPDINDQEKYLLDQKLEVLKSIN